MNKYKITIMDQNGIIYADIIQNYNWPSVISPYTNSSGYFGTIVKIELVLN